VPAIKSYKNGLLQTYLFHLAGQLLLGMPGGAIMNLTVRPVDGIAGLVTCVCCGALAVLIFYKNKRSKGISLT